MVTAPGSCLSYIRWPRYRHDWNSHCRSNMTEPGITVEKHVTFFDQCADGAQV